MLLGFRSKMTNKRKAEIIKGLTEYADLPVYRAKRLGVAVGGSRVEIYSERDGVLFIAGLMELITNPEWAKGVWTPKEQENKIIWVRWGSRTLALVKLHLEGKDTEIWEQLEARYQTIKDE